MNALILSLLAMALSLPLMKSNGVSAPNRLQPGPLDTNKALATVAAGCAGAKPLRGGAAWIAGLCTAVATMWTRALAKLLSMKIL